VNSVVRQLPHVLHVVPGLMPGGMELALARLVRATAGDNLRHTVVCLTGEAVLADQFPGSVAIHCLHAPPNDPRLPWRLRQLIRRLRPTVIHARNWGAWPDVAVARFFVRPRPPLIFSFHGFANTGRLPLRRRVAFRVLARMTTRLVTVSETTKRMLVEEFAWPTDNVRVIPNGIDTSRFSPLSDRAPSDRVRIGCVGGLTPVKNHALLIRAFASLRSAGVESDLQIAGEGPERASLERLARELGVADHVSLVGHVADVPRFLRQLDVFVLPSVSEAHPNALIEAMACGLPCAATSVGGVPEVFDGGRFGRLSPPAHVTQLAEVLRQLSASAAVRRELGTAARQRVIDRYSMDTMAAAYDDLYRETSSASCAAKYPRPADARPENGNQNPAQAVIGHADLTSGTNARSIRGRPSVLQLGPMPPLTGGMATVACNLSDSDLKHLCDLETINSGKTTPEGRPFLSGVWAQVRLLHRVLSTIRRRRVRLVHIHTCALFSFWRDIVHMMAVRAVGCRVVWHLHDGTFPRFISEGSRLKRAAIRWALRRGAATILLSEATLESLRPHAPGVNWRVVPNGVPLSERRKKGGEDCVNAAEASLKLIFLGNLTRRKGAYDLISATEIAAKQGVRAVLSLAGGESAPGQRLEIEQRIAGSPRASHIHLLGLVHGEQKQNAFNDADCVVLPSYAEGLPMALLEGMAEGLPAIATHVGSIPALINDGVEGFLVPAGDVEALADRICRLARDPALRRRMGQCARERVERDFSQRAMAERVFRIYQAAITGKTSPADEDDLQTDAIHV